MASQQRKAYVIQAPRFSENFDMKAVQAIGQVEHILPAAPNIHDPERVADDLEHVRQIIRHSSPDDVFLALGGAPLSNMLFGAAAALEGKAINTGLYTRVRDDDGRRDNGGKYKIVPLNLKGR